MYDLAPASQHVRLTAAYPVQLKSSPSRHPMSRDFFPVTEFDMGTGSSRRAVRWMPFAGDTSRRLNVKA